MSIILPFFDNIANISFFTRYFDLVLHLNIMNYKEYNEEHVELKNLESSFIPNDIYQNIHRTTAILCHDVFIRCSDGEKKGILLVKRLNEPAKNFFWPIGGRVLRGVPAEISIAEKVRLECGLELANITYLGTARTFFGAEPFGHNQGTDTLNIVYVADGIGKIALDSLHTSPFIVSKESYRSMVDHLPAYVLDFLNEIDTKNLWE